MVEVKIFCPCGSKYKFDVEPLNGRLPGPVKCPSCGADGTSQGNEIVAKAVQGTAAAQSAIPVQAPQTPVPAPSRGGFVAPVIPRSSKQAAAAGATSPPAVQVARIASGQQPAAEPVMASPAAPPVASAPPPHAGTGESRGASIYRGLVGIGIASLVSLIAWLVITTFLWRKLGWAAIALGGFIGWAGQALARQKSPALGIASAGAAVLVLCIGSIWSTVRDARAATDFDLKAAYALRVEYAKAAVEAKTDAEISELITDGLEFFENEDPAFSSVPEVNAATIAQWKSKHLPQLRTWAEGKVSQIQFEREKRPVIEREYSGGWVMSNAFRISMLIWIGLGGAAAWKVAATA